jgi:glycosyltransferase involved in cell wall biosynthesis
LQDAFPKIRSAVADARIAVLGGDGAHDRVRDDPAFAQPGVEIFGHRDDVAAFLDASALTINPQADIRGSSIKVIESLTAGRACVSTVDGARGFRDAGLAGLVLAQDVASMADPIIALLRDSTWRHRIEAPDASRLVRYQWSHSAQLQRALYDSLLVRDHGR